MSQSASSQLDVLRRQMDALSSMLPSVLLVSTFSDVCPTNASGWSDFLTGASLTDTCRVKSDRQVIKGERLNHEGRAIAEEMNETFGLSPEIKTCIRIAKIWKR